MCIFQTKFSYSAYAIRYSVVDTFLNYIRHFLLLEYSEIVIKVGISFL